MARRSKENMFEGDDECLQSDKKQSGSDLSSEINLIDSSRNKN